jgi:hypothetical protein
MVATVTSGVQEATVRSEANLGKNKKRLENAKKG